MTTDSSSADRKSSFDLEVAGEILSASASTGRSMQVGLAQYQTPAEWAKWFYTLLPKRPSRVFDPQCASGRLLAAANPAGYCQSSGYGWEIDPKFMSYEHLAGRTHQHVTGNCVTLWAMLDELYPDMRFECQVANPPFSILWNLPDGKTEDSTAYTWRRIQDKAAPDGFGFFIANASTIERLGLHQHPTVYLYQRFPVGMFPEAQVEIGVVHWWRRRAPFGDADPTAPYLHLVYQTLNRLEHAGALGMLREELARLMRPPNAEGDGLGTKAFDISDAWRTLMEIIEEERRERPPYNIWLKGDKLATWLSTRLQVREKLTPATIDRIARLQGQHPLALAPEAATRRTLREVLDSGIYTIQPEAAAAIRDALRDVESLSVPIMPVTGFEAVAYADEMDEVRCRKDFVQQNPRLKFTPGKAYPLTSGTYRFTETFNRSKLEYSEETKSTTVVVHNYSLSGEDRYIEVTDDFRVTHRFMDRPADKPQGKWLEHPESLLWEIFTRPTISTIAEALPAEVEAARRNLLLIQSTILA